ncbi:RNA polymerase subunit sigma-24 [Paenibacillus sambharensis]|uniref:RNA polymerase subunit sigma-24 n=1 Tax=Paenibacillus sambharensis TaxID=1803190 RepID=A0A2W1LRK5_9BACL|nr:sigma-70 family RNA polymerase sigma factor [Paenibacillus sambharensis]PZD97114.1 RNA polymerase subunit sigma-24 [Paenibacillus sambharensis]
MDIEELHELMEQHGKALYGFCLRLMGNKEDTDDLYQETLLKAIEGHSKVDRNRNPKAFLLSIAIGLRKNQRRKFSWRQRIAPTVAFNEAADTSYMFTKEDSPEDAVLTMELRCKIQAAADGLCDKLKIPLYMYYTADMSIEEIASVLKIPSGTVKSRLYQARKAMKKELEVDTL